MQRAPATLDLPQAPPRLSSLTFSTDAFDSAERFDYWRSLYSAVADVEVGREARAAFRSRTETWRVGPFTVMEASGSAVRFLRDARRCARDGLDHWGLRLSIGSGWTASVRGQSFRVPAGALSLKRLSDDSLFDLPAGDWRLLLIPADACPDIAAGLERLPRGPMRGAAAAVLADVLAALPDRLRTASEADAPALAQAIRGLLAACLMRSPATDAVTPRDATALLRERARRVIAAQIASPRLSPDRVAALLGVSRATLYRAFAPQGGVAEIVTALRLNLVAADLADPALAREPIAAIAERRGFHCASSFSRTFRRAFGCSPAEARAAAALGSLPPSAAPEAPATRPFRDPLGRLA